MAGHRDAACAAHVGQNVVKAKVHASRREPGGWLPVALIALVIIPGAGGVARLVALGVVVAFTALWLNEITPRPTLASQLLYFLRIAAGGGMAVSFVLGVTTIRSGDIAAHRAWMTRSYAIAFGAATQVFTIGFGRASLGESELTNALMQGAGWVINLAIAERAIRRRPGRCATRVLAEAAVA